MYFSIKTLIENFFSVLKYCLLLFRVDLKTGSLNCASGHIPLWRLEFLDYIRTSRVIPLPLMICDKYCRTTCQKPICKCGLHSNPFKLDFGLDLER